MKKYGWLILVMGLLVGSCQRQPIDKQEADAIVTQYFKKNFKTDDSTDQAVYYCNILDDERIELSFWYEEDEDIIAENAFVYYIDEDFNIGQFPHPHQIILVQKANGTYTIFQRTAPPYVKGLSVIDGSCWNLLFFFLNGEFWN